MTSGPTSSEKLKTITPHDYMEERVDGQITWYDRKSSANKFWFFAFQIFTLVASASVAVFSIFSDSMWARVLVATLGAGAAITTGIVSLYQFREHWVEYRTTAESLKHEKYMFLTRTDPYTGDNAFSVLVERVESLVSQENTLWQQRLKRQNEEDKNPG